MTERQKAMMSLDFESSVKERPRTPVPLDLYKYLDQSLFTFFSGEPHLSSFKIGLMDKGIHRVGELVQFTEPFIFNLVKTSQNNRRRVSDILKQYDLDFGMIAPDWRSPSRQNQLKVGSFVID